MRENVSKGADQTEIRAYEEYNQFSFHIMVSFRKSNPVATLNLSALLLCILPYLLDVYVAQWVSD